MNTRLNFMKAWQGAKNGLDYEIRPLRKYAVPMYSTLRGLFLDHVRLTRSVNLDSHAVDEFYGRDVNKLHAEWKRKHE